MRALLPLAAALALTVPVPVYGQNAEITVFGGYRFGGEFDDVDTDESQELCEGSSVGLIFDWTLDANRQVEVFYSRQETELPTTDPAAIESAIDMDVHYLQGGGTYVFDGERVRPYVAATLGLAHFDPAGPGLDTETRISASIGGGVKIYLSDNLGLRFEGRGLMTFFDSSGQAFCSGGCVVRVNASAFTQLEVSAGLMFAF